MNKNSISEEDIKNILISSEVKYILHQVDEDEIMNRISNIPDYKIQISRTRTMAKYGYRVSMFLIAILAVISVANLFSNVSSLFNAQLSFSNSIWFNLATVACVLFSVFVGLEFRRPTLIRSLTEN